MEINVELTKDRKSFTVGSLIEKLSEYPSAMEILFVVPDSGSVYNIDKVSIACDSNGDFVTVETLFEDP